MDIYTKSILMSWVEFLATLAGIALTIFLIIKACKYLRAILKRFSFIQRLRKACHDTGVKLEMLSSPYSSVFKPSDTSEILLDKNGEIYSVKFFPCINAKDIYQFDEEGRYHTISNFKPILLARPLPTVGLDPTKVKHLLMPRTLQYSDTIFKATGNNNFSANDIKNAKPLLCLNPVSVQMQKVKGSNVITIFDGDELCGYTAYSANGLLKFITE